MAFWNKEKKDQGLDVLDNIKEPFSFANFFEDHVVTRYKQFRALLEDHGVLFFLTSPFQARNRLLVKIVLVVLGVLIGIVPRSAYLIKMAQERNASSELATIAENVFRSGMIQIKPLMSSQREKQHILAFSILGDTNKGVPSTTDKYNVELKQSRGVSDAQNVHYKYEIIPMNNTQRLLLVYVDNREQHDETGIYNLYVQVANEVLTVEQQTPLEIILSNTQETTPLFNTSGIDMSVLTNKVFDDTSTPILTAEEKLNETLNVYEINEERLQALGITPNISTAAMRSYVTQETILPNITDTSTTFDITQMIYEEKTSSNIQKQLDISLTYNDITYDKTTKNTEQSDTNIVYDDLPLREIDDLITKTNNVVSALQSLNGTHIAKYNKLKVIRDILNQPVDIDTFKGEGTVI